LFIYEFEWGKKKKFNANITYNTNCFKNVIIKKQGIAGSPLATTVSKILQLIVLSAWVFGYSKVHSKEDFFL
jgi:Na+-driven multidrug efflux pump